ncbi:MAG TPA: FAD-dependent oxidoreductase, partial [Anaerolineaceae bacterium]|nr:FAD-dependent oxidoreductase [Anaerolineaceae bacterium]
MAKEKKHKPNWYEELVPPGTYRSLLKWGDPAAFKHPNSGLVKLMMSSFDLAPEDLDQPLDLALDRVELERPVLLEKSHIDAFTAICGVENISTDTYTRISRSYGSGMIDALRLRKKIIQNIPELVISPRSHSEVQEIITYSNQHQIPVYVYGAGSSVTRGVEAVKGGIALDMSTHMNRVVSFNETDQTITVETGMTGPQLEEILNHAPERLGAQRRYTCGHFPQSFEFSSVGGWVVTRGAGQNSTYYGKIEDIVISQRYATPRGELKTCPHPRSANGPDFDQ